MNSALKFARQVFASASFLSIVGTFLRVGGGLITLPLALRTIPSEQMGLYYTFLAVSGIAMLLDFGFAPTIARNAAYAMGGARQFVSKGLPELSDESGPNWELLAQLKFAVQRWYWCVSLLLAIGLLTLGSWFIYGRISESGLPTNLLLCWILFAITTSYNFATLYWQDLLIGIGSVRKAARIGLIVQSVVLILTIVGLLLGGGIWTYAVVGIFGTVVNRMWTRLAFLQDVVLPNVALCRDERRRVFASLWPMAWRQGVVMVGAFLIQRGCTLVSSSRLGLEETASYGLSLQILTLLFQVAVVPVSMAWPKIGVLRVQQRNSEIRALFFSRLYLGMGPAFVGIFVGSWIVPIALGFLGSQTSVLPPQLFMILGVILWLENHHSVYAGLVLSENNNPFILPALISGVLILSISWWAAGIWGILGIILTQGIIQLLWNNWWTVWRGIRGLPPSSPN